MSLPGELVRSRVVDAPANLLAALLDRKFTGHVTLEPADALLLDGDGRGILGFAAGIPQTAYHAGTRTDGTEALEALAGAGPFRVELYACSLQRIGEQSPGAHVGPADPARLLALDESLARRTVANAPETDPSDPSLDAVESFLADDAAIDDLKRRAREQAQRRAEEWDLPESE